MDYSNNTLLDREILNENTMGSVPLQEELFILFFEQGELYLSQLEDAVRDGDATAWRMTAHGVKGAARSLGMTRLAAIAMDAEKSPPEEGQLATLRTAMADTHLAVQPKEDAA